MSNMSYCRFENTQHDMEDCLEALRNEGELSADECRAAKRMFVDILIYLLEVGIIEDYDRKALIEFLDGKKKPVQEAE